MQTNVVLTLTGPDRLGIVENVTGVLLDAGANVEKSSMARLGGEFAIIMLATLPAEQVDNLNDAFSELTAEGYTLGVHETHSGLTRPHSGWDPYRIEVSGADHEGIIHEIARGLSRNGINIETMETGTLPAPVSGALLFTMRAVVAVPRSLSEADWTAELVEACRQANVDVTISVAEPDWDAAV